MPTKEVTRAAKKRWRTEDEETAAYLADQLLQGKTVCVGTEFTREKLRDGETITVRRIITPALVARANELFSAEKAKQPEQA